MGVGGGQWRLWRWRGGGELERPPKVALPSSAVIERGKDGRRGLSAAISLRSKSSNASSDGSMIEREAGVGEDVPPSKSPKSSSSSAPAGDENSVFPKSSSVKLEWKPEEAGEMLIFGAKLSEGNAVVVVGPTMVACDPLRATGESLSVVKGPQSASCEPSVDAIRQRRTHVVRVGTDGASGEALANALEAVLEAKLWRPALGPPRRFGKRKVVVVARIEASRPVEPPGVVAVVVLVR